MIQELGYGQDCIRDEADQQRLNSLTILDKETELADRFAKVEEFIERRKILQEQTPTVTQDEAKARLQALASKQNRQDYSSESDPSIDSEDEPMDNLDKDYPPVPREQNSPRQRIQRKFSVGSDDDEEAFKLVDLKKMRIRRTDVEKWVNEEFLERVLKDSYVKINIGSGRDGKTNYRVGKIIDFRKRDRPYPFGKGQTNLMLKVAHGKSTKTFKLNFISNSDIDKYEMETWIKAMESGNMELPAPREVHTKYEQIKQYRMRMSSPEQMNKNREKLIDDMIATGNVNQNLTHLVAYLTEQVKTHEDLQAQSKDPERERILEQQRIKLTKIKEIKKRKEEETLAKQTNAYNNRAALAQIEEDKKLSRIRQREAINISNENGFDPFSRRACAPEVLWGTGNDDQTPKLEKAKSSTKNIEEENTETHFQ